MRRGGRWREKAWRPSSVTSMHPFTFSFFSEANSVGIRASAWSSMLTIFREHFRDRTETELNRQSSAGRNGDASERASGTSLCLDLESTDLHLRQTREHVFRSWQPSFPNTAYSRSSPLRLDAQTSAYSRSSLWSFRAVNLASTSPTTASTPSPSSSHD